MTNNKKRVILVLLILLVYLVQFILIKDTRIDGDVMNLMVNNYQQDILLHKFGIQNIFSDIKYANSNRYISFLCQHIFFVSFDSVYSIFKSFFPKHEFIYIYIAFAKLLVQFFISILLCQLISIDKSKICLNFLIITLLVQHFGFYGQFGIIDHSITYLFFYGITMIGHLSQFIILKKYYKNFNLINATVFLGISWLTVFSGSINYAIQLVTIPFLLYYFRKEKNILLKTTLILSWFFGILSYLVNLQNIEGQDSSVTIIMRYGLALKGLFILIFHHIGWAILLLFLYYQFKIYSKNNTLKIDKGIIRSVIGFILLYLILIPMGGYRPYRPYIIRYDVIIPISLCVFGMIIYLNQFLVSIKNYSKILLLFCLILFGFQFYKIDRNANQEEKKILAEIENSKNLKIKVSKGSKFLAWDKIEPWQKDDLNKFLDLLGFIQGNQLVEIVSD